MGRFNEEIVKKTYQLYLDEGNENITYDEFLNTIVVDEEFNEYFDTLFERAKGLIIKERIK